MIGQVILMMSLPRLPKPCIQICRLKRQPLVVVPMRVSTLSESQVDNSQNCHRKRSGILMAAEATAIARRMRVGNESLTSFFNNGQPMRAAGSKHTGKRMISCQASK